MHLPTISLLTLIVCLAFSGSPAFANTSLVQRQFLVESMVQKSIVTISRSSLAKASLLLNIDAPQNSQVRGSVKINGRIVANLQTTRSIDLTKCLNSSTCEVDITATYNPASSIGVKIYSTNDAISSTLQSSGSGVLQQKLVINIE